MLIFGGVTPSVKMVCKHCMGPLSQQCPHLTHFFRMQPPCKIQVHHLQGPGGFATLTFRNRAGGPWDEFTRKGWMFGEPCCDDLSCLVLTCVVLSCMFFLFFSFLFCSFLFFSFLFFSSLLFSSLLFSFLPFSSLLFSSLLFSFLFFLPFFRRSLSFCLSSFLSIHLPIHRSIQPVSIHLAITKLSCMLLFTFLRTSISKRNHLSKLSIPDGLAGHKVPRKKLEF